MNAASKPQHKTNGELELERAKQQQHTRNTNGMFRVSENLLGFEFFTPVLDDAITAFWQRAKSHREVRASLYLERLNIGIDTWNKTSDVYLAFDDNDSDALVGDDMLCIRAYELADVAEY